MRQNQLVLKQNDSGDGIVLKTGQAGDKSTGFGNDKQIIAQLAPSAPSR